MFAIQPINRLYKDKRYIGLREDKIIPYLIYEGNSDYPNDIYGFANKEDALTYLTCFVDRTEINKMKLTTSQIVDIALVNNCVGFQIVEYEIQEGNMIILNILPQPQFNKKGG